MRGILILGTVALLGVVACAQDDKVRALRFSKDDMGKAPSGWTADRTGKGAVSVWKVVADETAPSKTGYVLAQTSESPGSVFNLCVANDTNHKDVEVSVAFKAMKGK